MRFNSSATAAFFMLSVTVHAQSNIVHPGIEYYVADKNIKVNALINSSAPLKEGRVYFKEASQPSYAFTKMSCNGGLCSGDIPAASESVSSIEYVILTQDAQGAITKTPAFTTAINKGGATPAWQKGATSKITVYTELGDKNIATSQLSNFSNQLSAYTVPFSEKLGLVSGLTAASEAGISSNTSSTTSNASSMNQSNYSLNNARSDYNNAQSAYDTVKGNSNSGYQESPYHTPDATTNSQYDNAMAAGMGAAGMGATSSSSGMGALGWTLVGVGTIAGVGAITSSAEETYAAPVSGSCVIKYGSSGYDYVFIAQNYPQDACSTLATYYDSYTYWTVNFYTYYTSCSSYTSYSYCSAYDYGY